MKIIFYDKNQLISSNNIDFKTNIPQKQKIISQNSLPHESFMDGYYTIFKDDNKIKMIYRASRPINGHNINQMHSKCDSWDHSTCIAIDFIKPKNNIILKGKCASHNFCPIITPNGKYYGIGGLHAKTSYHTKCKNIKNIKHKGKILKNPNEYHPCHCNGLYLFKSNDLYKWSLVKKIPIISGLHTGQIDGRWGWSEYDGKISCFYSKILKKYVIYVRSNVYTRRRWVQMATSNDLINWSSFKLLNVIPKFNMEKDNYYHMDVMDYPGTNLLIGFSPYTDGTEQNSYIAILLSKDGVNWGRYGKILNAPLDKLKKRNSIHTTGVFLENNNNFDFYFHENYCNFQNKGKSQIYKYSLKKDRIFQLSSKNGEFTIQLNIKDKLIVNYQTKKDGYIKLQIDKKEYILKGDELEKQLNVNLNKKIFIKCELKNGILYSLII